MSCRDFDANLRFFTEQIGFRIDSIFPADNPQTGVVSGYGLKLRLEQKDTQDNENICLRLNCVSPDKDLLVAPNGVRIEFVESGFPHVALRPEASLIINKLSENADWINGRAGMRYRDLIPDRLGGYLIASHIHIPDAGPVPDYVHFHKVQFQMIYCYKGWVKVVYEDQGEPFVMNEGDCVLQPPGIRHRVLEASENLEVIEISSPAEHITYADHDMSLPNQVVKPEREFDGQSFLRHVAKNAVWETWKMDGFECRDTGIGAATKGLARVHVVRPVADPVSGMTRPDGEFEFLFILRGAISFHRDNGDPNLLTCGDSLVIPGDLGYRFSNCSDDLEFLAVTFC